MNSHGQIHVEIKPEDVPEKGWSYIGVYYGAFYNEGDPVGISLSIREEGKEPYACHVMVPWFIPEVLRQAKRIEMGHEHRRIRQLLGIDT